MKVHGLAFPKQCRHAEFECEDYCRWSAAGWHNGKAYGYFKIKALAVFGFSGFKLIEETYNEPGRVGCAQGREAAVVIRNERNCQNHEDREIQRRCWSADDKVCDKGTIRNQEIPFRWAGTRSPKNGALDSNPVSGETRCSSVNLWTRVGRRSDSMFMEESLKIEERTASTML